MSAADYIEALRASNPRVLAATRISLDVREFENQIRKAFQAGQKAAQDEKSMFEKVFGK